MSAASRRREYCRRFLHGFPTLDLFRAWQVSELPLWLAAHPNQPPVSFVPMTRPLMVGERLTGETYAVGEMTFPEPETSEATEVCSL